jgi:hypothetical protein
MALSLPAICDSCGTVFPSGFAVSGTVEYCQAGPCPVCGGKGSIPNGTYQIIGNIITLLAGPQKTVNQLRSLAGIITEARKVVNEPNNAVAKIKNEAPELSSIVDSLPKIRMELYAFLSLIIFAIATIIAAYTSFKDKGPTEEEVQGLIDKSIERAFKENPTTEKPQPYRSKPKTGRNEPCHCGSGKKYKKCCWLQI